MIRRTTHLFLGISLMGVLLTMCLSTDAHASGVDWSLPGLTVTPLTEKPAPDSLPVNNSCQNEAFFVGNSMTQESGCVYAADGFDYAFVDRRTSTWWGGRSNYQIFVIRFGSETRMHIVYGLFSLNQPSYIVPVPHSKHIIFNIPNVNTWGSSTYIIKNLPAHLERTIAGDLSVEYWVKSNSREPLIKNDAGSIKKNQRLTVAPDGRWGVVEVSSLGLVRIDFNDLSFRWYSRYEPSGMELHGSSTRYAITNDGRHIVATGKGGQTRVAEVNDNCGQYIKETFPITPVLPDAFCPEHVLDSDINTVLQDTVETVDYMTFNYDGGELELFASPRWQNDKEYKPVWIRFSPQGYNAGRVAYLALGDSYSSGEGDTGKKADGSSYYLPRTNSGKDNCHISERSYPYLISDHFGINPAHMRSVACSGARVVFDYYRPLTNYTGQNERLSQLNSSDDISHAQDEALDSYMPGYVPQLEFVKKYQPRAITLTGGGNDVGFGSLIEYCASFHWESIVADDTCGFALPNSDLRKMLGRTIYDQYAYTIRLINAIKQASPETLVNIVGYPSFIAGRSSPCALNSGVLDGDERDMINEGVAYMNDVLEKAANETGVQFIDIENSLVGGRLCEGSRFVTGVVNINFDLATRKQELFHPNALGHQKIASTILSSGKLSFVGNASPLMTSSIEPPAIPAYFGGETTQGVVTRQENILLTDQIPQNEFITLNLPAQTFQPGSTITVAMYSSPIDLGTYTTSPDGATEVQIRLPKEAYIGRHIISVTGNSYSGEPLQLFQFAEVTSGDPADKDGDGIKDTEDKCDYISHYYDEMTGKDICVQSDPGPEPGLFPTTGQLGTLERTRSTDVKSDANEAGAASFGIESSEVAKLFTAPGISVSDRSNDLKWQGKEVTFREFILIIICIIVGMVVAIGAVYAKSRR